MKVKKYQMDAECPCCGTRGLILFGEFECPKCGYCVIVEESGE